MASPEKKGKFNTKLLAAIIIIIVVVSLSAVAAQYALTKPRQNNALSGVSLVLVGSDGTTKTLNENDLLALSAYTASGATRSGNKVGATQTYTGVPVTTLLDLVGGIKSGETVTATAKDAYTTIYTYNQVVNGQDFNTYNSNGDAITATQPLKLVVIYYCQGAALASDDGPLKMGVLSTEGLATQGNQWEKMVVKLQVNNAATPQPSASAAAVPTAKPTATAKPSQTTSPTAAPTPSPTPSVTIADCQVTIIGADNTTKVLNKADLLGYPMTSGLGGKYKSSDGVFAYGTYSGVSMTTLLASVGGMTSSQVISVKAADTWVKNYSYTEVTGTGLTMYDPTTVSVATPSHPVTMILSYALNGTSTNLQSFNGDGTPYLMISFVGDDGYATIANLFSKYVIEIHVYDA
jgi:hypothetical protein